MVDWACETLHCHNSQKIFQPLDAVNEITRPWLEKMINVMIGVRIYIMICSIA